MFKRLNAKNTIWKHEAARERAWGEPDIFTLVSDPVWRIFVHEKTRVVFIH